MMIVDCSAYGPGSGVKPKKPRKPPMCEGCGQNRADPPSPLCPGCQAYREHQQ